MIRSDVGFDWEGRNRRPPRDPVNCLLSFAYSLIVKDLTATVYGVGFDPYSGFYHGRGSGGRRWHWTLPRSSGP